MNPFDVIPKDKLQMYENIKEKIKGKGEGDVITKLFDDLMPKVVTSLKKMQERAGDLQDPGITSALTSAYLSVVTLTNALAELAAAADFVEAKASGALDEITPSRLSDDEIN